LGAQAENQEEHSIFRAIRRTLRWVATPGLLLVFIGGLAMVIPGWSAYRSMGWLHAKIGLALLLAGGHGIMLRRLRLMEEQKAKLPSGFFGLWAVLFAGGALLFLALALFRPF
ncbi:MAG: hypothetical protein N2515_01800, partial [Deltaproteobacteria bacterium]|nr:hypothetical protein [Deltaproteobacteria bacterium]